MKKYLIVMVVALLAYVGFAQADSMIIQDLTEDGSDPGIQDASVMKSIPWDPWTNKGCPECGDENLGTDKEMIIYSDGGPFQNQSIGPRHTLFKFDVSALQYMNVTDAELVVWQRTRRRNQPCCIPIAELKLSRILPGLDWVEGTTNAPALDGDVTWNSRKHYLDPAWDAIDPAGAASPLDIDLASTVDIPYIAGLRQGEMREMRVNVTEFVQAWAGGVENNGMVLWGGYVPEAEECNVHFVLWRIGLFSSEAQPGERMVGYDEEGNPYDLYTWIEQRPAF